MHPVLVATRFFFFSLSAQFIFRLHFFLEGGRKCPVIESKGRRERRGTATLAGPAARRGFLARYCSGAPGSGEPAGDGSG